MATTSVINNNKKKIYLYRGNTANDELYENQYRPDSQFKVGITNPDASATSIDLKMPINITEDTINDDGNINLTGSVGGENTTDNTTIFKHGPGAYDNIAQNLLTNTTSTDKIWTASVVELEPEKFLGLWIYISDATALGKINEDINIKLRNSGDTENYYYELNFNKGDLETGWNFISSYPTKIEDLETGSSGAPTGAINELIIKVVTENASDNFSEGDLVYDLLKSYTIDNIFKSFISGYPIIDLGNLEVEARAFLSTIEANGFFLNSFATFNDDDVPLMTSEETFAGESKSNIDEFTFSITDRFL